MEAGFGAVVAYDAAKGVEYNGEEKVQMSLLRVDQTNVGEFKEQFLDKEQSYDWAGASRAENPDVEYNFNLTLE